jgi:GntR family transcriptional repressor for pyruvate dehydrogenase complex
MSDQKTTIKDKPNLSMYLNQDYDYLPYPSNKTPSRNQPHPLASGLDHSENMAERLVRVLVRYISENQLKPGDQLPVEKKLGEILGIGNRPLREALIILRTIGLVTAKPGKGWFVGKIDLATNLKFLSPLLEEFSGEEIEDVMRLRLANEPVIARLAAKNITESGLEMLEAVLLHMKESFSDNSEGLFRGYDRDFHIILARECGSNMLSMLNSILSGLF